MHMHLTTATRRQPICS